MLIKLVRAGWLAPKSPAGSAAKHGLAPGLNLYGAPHQLDPLIRWDRKSGVVSGQCSIRISFRNTSYRRFYRSPRGYPRFGARPDLPISEATVRLGMMRNTRSMLQHKKPTSLVGRV